MAISLAQAPIHKASVIFRSSLQCLTPCHEQCLHNAWQASNVSTSGDRPTTALSRPAASMVNCGLAHSSISGRLTNSSIGSCPRPRLGSRSLLPAWRGRCLESPGRSTRARGTHRLPLSRLTAPPLSIGTTLVLAALNRAVWPCAKRAWAIWRNRPPCTASSISSPPRVQVSISGTNGCRIGARLRSD